MNILDAYGNFDLPEEKAVIEVVEDPVKTILSTYKLFRGTVEKKLNEKELEGYGPNWVYEKEFRNYLYEETAKLFDGKEQTKLSDEQLKQVTCEIKYKQKPWDATGIFFSALQNKTQLELLVADGLPAISVIGYKLKPNKTVVLGPETKAISLGYQAEGNTINLGEVRYQGAEATKGMHINSGALDFMGWALFGEQSKGVWVNIGRFLAYFSIEENIALAQDGVSRMLKYEDFEKSLQKKPSRLEKKLKELDFLKATKNNAGHNKCTNSVMSGGSGEGQNLSRSLGPSLDMDELAKKIRSFDFQEFEKRLREIVRDYRVNKAG